MTRTYLPLLLVMFFMEQLTAQYPLDHKRDRQWLFGINYWGGQSRLDFNTEPPTVHTLNVPDALGYCRTQAIICDTAGQVKLSCNGESFGGSDFRDLPFVPPLNYGAQGFGSGTLGRETCIILPLGDGSEKYYVIHSNGFPVRLPNTNVAYGGKGLRYGIIDMDMNNGRGGALFTDSLLVNDTLTVGGLVACRHANGRDWWILTTRLGSPLVSRFLVTPYGITLQGTQALTHSIEFGAEGQTCFSPDGTKFADFRSSLFTPVKLNIFDFDRCTGLLSNQQQYEFTILYPYVSVGCSFSPNSKRLYFSDVDKIFQLNLDLPASQVWSSLDTVAVFDGFTDFDANGIAIHDTGFEYHQLAPNNKIYLSAQNTYYLHTIHSPDSLGRACDVRQHDLRLPSLNYAIVPNYPNFRLGPLDGSGCDTLGIDVVSSIDGPTPDPKGEIRAWPNPTTGIFQYEIAGSGKAQRIVIYDMLGRIVQAPVNLQVGQVDLSELADGVYILEIQAAGKVLAREKVVKQGN